MVWYIWLFDPVGRYLAADQRGDTYDGVFFPDQMLNASNGVDELMSATPMWIDLLVVAVTPAICEEIAFRGALLTCFRGTRSKWTGIIIVGLFFGACHGSVWRMVPTAILDLLWGLCSV